MQFLNHPLPDYEGMDNLSDDQQVTNADYDTSLPFEKRPAIEKPPFIMELQPTMDKSNIGHITWHFDSPIPPKNENKMEN